MKKNIVCILIFSIFLLISISFAECNHVYEIIEINNEGKHSRKCTLCNYSESSDKHILESSWSFDNEGKYHFNKCEVEGCEYEYNNHPIIRLGA